MVRYLVTGGYGFIGSSLVRLLRQKVPLDSIVVLDKLTYAANPANLDGIVHEFIRGDLCDPQAVRSCHADVVFHLAAETHVDRSITDAAPFAATNVVGTQVLLDAAVDWRVKLFVHISTDEVYGSGGPFREQDPLRPRNPYAASKAGAEHLVQAYAVTHGLPVIVTRCCNNYGPRQFPEKLIPKAIQHILRGTSAPLYGDGLHRREWLHVADHCEALWLLAERGKIGETYNITSGRRMSNIEILETVIRVMGKGEYHFVEDRPGHDREYVLDSSKLAALGWQPKIGLEEGIRETIDFYRPQPPHQSSLHS